MLALILFARMTLALQVATAPAHDGRVIVRLVSRQQDISVLSTAHGVRYSAADKQGRILVSNATLLDLKQQHPEIYKLIAPVVCSTADAPAAYAGMEISADR
ncbi:MAG TPA: hypothetical protein VHS31_03755 [Tepidisphaeraceae bacterium]|jgi:hypothetical protein|nr:hypothetical protein [Tepidisphaeraceae bacterium]